MTVGKKKCNASTVCVDGGAGRIAWVGGTVGDDSTRDSVIAGEACVVIEGVIPNGMVAVVEVVRVGYAAGWSEEVHEAPSSRIKKVTINARAAPGEEIIETQLGAK